MHAEITMRPKLKTRETMMMTDSQGIDFVVSSEGAFQVRRTFNSWSIAARGIARILDTSVMSENIALRLAMSA